MSSEGDKKGKQTYDSSKPHSFPAFASSSYRHIEPPVVKDHDVQHVVMTLFWAGFWGAKMRQAGEQSAKGFHISFVKVVMPSR